MTTPIRETEHALTDDLPSPRETEENEYEFEPTIVRGLE